MKVIDVKKRFLALIDEFAPENKEFTEDEDANVKFKELLGLAYSKMAEQKPIIKTKELDFTYTGKDYYQENSLPRCKMIKKIIAFDENNREISGDYHFLGEKKIFINQNKKATYYLEYIAYPTIINSETDDEFELEIAQDAQEFLAYDIANDYLKTDPSANYASFQNEYLRMLQNFDTRTKGVMIEINESEAF